MSLLKVSGKHRLEKIPLGLQSMDNDPDGRTLICTQNEVAFSLLSDPLIKWSAGHELPADFVCMQIVLGRLRIKNDEESMLEQNVVLVRGLGHCVRAYSVDTASGLSVLSGFQQIWKESVLNWKSEHGNEDGNTQMGIRSMCWVDQLLVIAFDDGVVGAWVWVDKTVSLRHVGSWRVHCQPGSTIGDLKMVRVGDGSSDYVLAISTTHGAVGCLQFRFNIQNDEMSVVNLHWDCVRAEKTVPHQVSALGVHTLPNDPTTILLTYSMPFSLEFRQISSVYEGGDVLMENALAVNQASMHPSVSVALPGMAASGIVLLDELTRGVVCTPDGYLGTFVLSMDPMRVTWTDEGRRLRQLLVHRNHLSMTPSQESTGENSNEKVESTTDQEEENEVEEEVMASGSVENQVDRVFFNEDMVEFYGASISPNSLFICLFYRLKSHIFRPRWQKANISFVEYLPVAETAPTPDMLLNQITAQNNVERIWDIISWVKQQNDLTLVHTIVDGLCERLDTQFSAELLRALFLFLTLSNNKRMKTKAHLLKSTLAQLNQDPQATISPPDHQSWKTWADADVTPPTEMTEMDQPCILCQTKLEVRSNHQAVCQNNHRWSICPLSRALLVDPFDAVHCERCLSVFSGGARQATGMGRCWFCRGQLYREFK